MQFSLALFVRLVLCGILLHIAAATPNVRDETLAHLRRLKHSAAFTRPLNPEMLYGLKSTVGGGSARRELKGMEACTWDEYTSSCDTSMEVSSSLLEKADNQVARYLYRIFECYQYGTHDRCESNGCQWYQNMCSYTFKDYKQMASSPCLANANQIVDTVAWSIECSDIEDDFACNVADHCYWTEDQCVFDRWTYYFDIQTIDSVPEGFDELFDQRTDQLEKFFMEKYDESNSEESLNELLYTTLPDFNCPFGYETLVCQYVEAISQVQQVTYYCTMKYQTESGCYKDAYCTLLTDPQEMCAASDEQILLSIFEGEKVFNSAITDPDARKLEDKRLQCQMQETTYSCTGDCQWSYDGMCLLSGQWVEKYIYDIIGESDDPVCQYFVLPTTTGCIDRSSEFQCAFDEKCYWSVANEYCMAGMQYSIELALDAADLGCSFRNISEACQACETKRECRRVPDYDESAHAEHGMMSGSHSSSQRVFVQSNGEIESSESTRSKSSSHLWLLIIPIGLVLAGLAVMWHYRKKIQTMATDGWNNMHYTAVGDPVNR